MRLFRVIRAMLREIFDESAYERFCAENRVGRCGESYVRFLEERAGTSKGARCC